MGETVFVHTCPLSWGQDRIMVHSSGLRLQRPELNTQLCHSQLWDSGQATSLSLSHLNCQMRRKITHSLQGYSLSTLLLPPHPAIWHLAGHHGLGVKPYNVPDLHQQKADILLQAVLAMPSALRTQTDTQKLAVNTE